MNVRGFHHLAIQVRDLPGAVAFYAGVLGLKELTRHHRPDGTLRAVWLEVAPGFLALEACEGEPRATAFQDATPGLHLLALRIEAKDRQALIDSLAQRGVEVVHQSRWTVYVRDPEGNRIGLSHHPEDPPSP